MSTDAIVLLKEDHKRVKKLFKDQATFRAEEKTRFELLEAHWDVPLNEVNFEARQPVGR